MKNYLKYTLWLAILIPVVLLLLNYLPPLTVFGYTMRRVDILGDIRSPLPYEAEDEDSISVSLPPIVKPVFVDTCKAGITCIEDYSDSTKRGMTPFYEALGKIKSLNRPVRIAVFGDSFIEADILTADLREMLQDEYGGCGAGFVDITSSTYGFRPSVRHSFKGWESHSQGDSTYFDRRRQGPSGHYSIPSPNAYMELRGQSKYASRLDTCEQSSIYFYNKGEANISAIVNKKTEAPRLFAPTGGLQKMSVNGHIGSVRWVVNNADSTVFYGASMDGLTGVVVDNFSLRGSSGLSLSGIPVKTLREFNELRTYDLIILLYGLNVASERGKDYGYYQKGMKKSIEYLKGCFPQAGFLLTSVSDRNYKTETGDMKTMPGVKNLIRYQQAIAAENNIAFWNMYEAMGGEGSMEKLVRSTPPKANYDYTHINFRGGKELAALLYDTMVYGKEQYDRRRAYEKE